MIRFGVPQRGAHPWSLPEGEARPLIRQAIEAGINFFDTANVYSDGTSEEIVGKALRQWNGGKIYVATKVQPVRWPSPDDDDPGMRGRYPAWYLREEVEGCLRRLRVERMDVLQLHCWMPAGIRELDWLETLNALRLEGKIDRIGVSLRDYRPESFDDPGRYRARIDDLRGQAQQLKRSNRDHIKTVSAYSDRISHSIRKLANKYPPWLVSVRLVGSDPQLLTKLRDHFFHQYETNNGHWRISGVEQVSKPDRRIATDSGAGLLDLLLVHQNTACEDQRLRLCS